jgi:hypothetical protein
MLPLCQGQQQQQQCCLPLSLFAPGCLLLLFCCLEMGGSWDAWARNSENETSDKTACWALVGLPLFFL